MIELRLLGSLELTASDGAPILSVLSQPKRVGILAYLTAARPHGFHRRDKLLALFWSEADAQHARGSLRQALHFLRRSLSEAAVPNRGDDEVGIDPELIWCDVVAFEEALDRGALAEAMELYRGDLLGAFHVPEAPELGRWIDTERERLRIRAVAAGEELADRAAAAGDLGEAVALARRVVELAPGTGRAVARLVDLLARSGDRAGALRAYESFAELLDEEFDIEPPDDLQELVDRIRSGTQGASVPLETAPPSLARAVLASEVTPIADQAATPLPVEASVARRGRTLLTRSLLAALAIATVWTSYSVYRRGRGGAGGPIIVFVSSFADPTPDARFGVNAAGIQSEITNALVRSTLFQPSAPTAALEDGDIRADYMVGGGLRPNGEELRVAVQFSNMDTERTVWMGQYDYAMGDVDAEEQIAMAVVEAMEQELLEPDRVERVQRTATGTEIDPEARFAYSVGRSRWLQRQPALFDQALDYFYKAARLDPNYARARAAIADVYILQGAYDYGVRRPSDVLPVAADAARLAIGLDSLLPAARAALASTQLTYFWDLDAARQGLEHAIRLDSLYAPAHHWYSLLLMVEGRFEESGQHIQRAREIAVAEAVVWSAEGRNSYYRGRYTDAIRQYQKSIELDPDFPPGHVGLGLTFVLDERYDAAMEEYKAAEEILGAVPLVLALQGHLLGTTGDKDGAAEVFDQLENHPLYVPPEYLAIVALGMGEHDRALDFFERAYEEQSGAMIFLHVDPMLEPLRDDPRFQALIDRVGVARN